jgi:GT2 family glycosyltransferase
MPITTHRQTSVLGDVCQIGEIVGTVVIPTKDKVEMLAACLEGTRRTAPANFEIIIVDNGSQNNATWRFYESLKCDKRVRVLEAPGPFNFSTLCNRASTVARGQVLVFLNNDIFGMTPGWLDLLVAWALRPGIGAVGVRLLFPSGRLQHGGVVLGLAGYAAHIDAGLKGNHAGYLGRLAAPHEISAVTAACMAVEKQRFAAVGGFDEENFPVELGDMDLCLRLGQAGFKTIMLPEISLFHHESASRGKAPAAGNQYAFEKGRFLARWGHLLDDDPYFHPALSLKSAQTMLE